MVIMEFEVLFRRLDPALKKRKFWTKPKDRIVARISKQTYPFIYAYAMKHEPNIEEAVDELFRISLQNIYSPRRCSFEEKAFYPVV